MKGMASQSDEALLPDILNNLLVIECVSIHAVELDQQFLSGSLSQLHLKFHSALKLFLLDLEGISVDDANLHDERCTLSPPLSII